MSREPDIDTLEEDEETVHQRFVLAYGDALLQWARLEQHLFFWFEIITGMDHMMARAVFYSPRNFNGRSEMLEAAINTRKSRPT